MCVCVFCMRSFAFLCVCACVHACGWMCVSACTHRPPFRAIFHLLSVACPSFVRFIAVIVWTAGDIPGAINHLLRAISIFERALVSSCVRMCYPVVARYEVGGGCLSLTATVLLAG